MGNLGRRKFIDILRMDITIWISVILAVITFTTPVRSSEPRVVCYYTNWSVYRPGTARFNPQNINPYLCTHLVYAFGGFTKDNELKPFDKYQDIEKGGYAKFNGLKTYNKNLKTMLAIGGWNEGSARFSPLVASRESRKVFVKNVIKFLRQNHFDGLDLDWEYPAFRDGGKPKDRENYAKLVRELREEFEKESEKTGKTRLLLTMAVPAGTQYIDKGFDLKTMNQYLDWMNLLAYDYHSAFEPAVNHHAPLYPLEEPNEYSVDDDLNIDYTVKFYLERGVDREKLVIGIPTYGRSYTLFNPDAYELGSPADGPGEQGDATREKGYLAYYEICEALMPKEKSKKRASGSDEDSEEDEEEEEEKPWVVMNPNPNAMGPIAVRGKQWVGYDDVDMVRKKADYVAENGLGGIMFWSIDNDDFRGTCHGKPYPLIEAAKENYIAKLGSKDNVVVSEKPAAAANRRRPGRPRSSTTTTTTTTTAKPSSRNKSNKNRGSSGTSPASVGTTTPAWNIVTPEPPTTPDPGADFKCTDEGFYPHPRDCKKYFWCLDSGPSNLGIVAHQFTCPSGLFFNKAADSCDFARNVLCKVKPQTTTTKATTTPTSTTTTTTTTTTTRKPIKPSSISASLFRSSSTTSTTPEPESEEEYEEEDEDKEDSTNVDAEDPKVLKDLIDLIKKLGGVEQLEKHLRLGEPLPSTDGLVSTTPSSYKMKLYQVLQRTQGKTTFSDNTITESSVQNSRRGPQSDGLQPSSDRDKLYRKDRPQYVTINRARPSLTTTTEGAENDAVDVASSEEPDQTFGRVTEPEIKGASTKPLNTQYVNIRRARPTTLATSDTADDTASRNALFERVESYVTVSNAPITIDITNARRENVPEYVTIRRQRPTTEEATTVQYQNSEREVLTTLEKELSSPTTQSPYTTIVRARTTTAPPPEELSSPEPTTVLAVQLSSLLNTPSPGIVESPQPETSALTTEVTEPTTTPSTTLKTTTSTTTATPTSLFPRRNVQRRRGSTTSTTTSTSAPSPTTQAAVERRKPFLRRTKATAPPETSESPTEPISNVETSTRKYPNRRGGTRFKIRNEAEAGAKRKPSQNELEKGQGPEKGASSGDAEKGAAQNDEDNNIGNRARRPYLNGSETRSERPPPTRFLRRRVGGANSSTASTTVTTASLAVSSTEATTRRPYRVASRRRIPSRTSTTSTTTTTEAATVAMTSSVSVPNTSGDDGIEDTSRSEVSTDRTDKIQRRPLVTQTEETAKDQNPSATNEEENKRQSKKYSSSFKQNQLDGVLKQSSSKEETDDSEAQVNRDVTEKIKTTTEDYRSTIEGYSPETAVAIAAHQLLAAPLPIVPNYEEEYLPRKSTPKPTTQEYKQTNTEYASAINTRTPVTIYSEDFSSTPLYRSRSRDYIQTSPRDAYSEIPSRTSPFSELTLTTATVPDTYSTSDLDIPKTTSYSANTARSSAYSPTGFTISSTNKDYLSTEYFSKSPPTVLTAPKSTTFSTDFSGFTTEKAYDGVSQDFDDLSKTFVSNTISKSSGYTNPYVVTSQTGLPPTPSISNTGLTGVSQSLSPATSRYLSSTDKYVEGTVGPYGYTTSGFTGRSQEPTYFTKEYLLESPATKTSDDQYQYLSPVTSQSTTIKKLRKTIYRKISTTIPPTTTSVTTPVATTPKPRRTSTRRPAEPVPFEKVQKTEQRTYRPIQNYDYYDESSEKVAHKYVEGTKVVVHGSGSIECLDIGNFPHPTSCKKFIQCARMESGATVGWEYICPKGLSFDPIGGICNWSAGLGCTEKELAFSSHPNPEDLSVY